MRACAASALFSHAIAFCAASAAKSRLQGSKLAVFDALKSGRGGEAAIQRSLVGTPVLQRLLYEVKHLKTAERVGTPGRSFLLFDGALAECYKRAARERLHVLPNSSSHMVVMIPMIVMPIMMVVIVMNLIDDAR